MPHTSSIVNVRKPIINKAEFFDLHSEYKKFSPRWETVTDIIDGEPELKRKDYECIGTYLIKIPLVGSDLEYFRRRNYEYIQGASFSNFTESTLVGYMGMLFRTPPVIPDLPESLQYIVEDSDGNGLPLDQHARNTAEKVTAIGRQGVLVDMPPSLGRESTKAENAQGHRAKFKTYTAQSIQFWRHNERGKIDVVILHEVKQEMEKGSDFKTKDVDTWRVLTLQDNVYKSVVFDKEGKLFNGEEEITPVDSTGKPLDFIPFIFFGSMDNQPDVDMLPLEPIALVNLAHYRNSADNESSSRQLSAATPWVADNGFQNKQNDPNDKKEKTVTLGENGFIVMGTSGNAGFMQVDPNNIVAALSDKKETQMIALGAAIITPNGPAETAEAARIKKAGQVSRLEVIGMNISSGYTNLLEWAGLFMGAEIEESYVLNKDFLGQTLTPEQRKQVVAEWQGDFLPHRIALEQFKKAGIFELKEGETLDDIRNEISQQGPGLDFGEDERTG